MTAPGLRGAVTLNNGTCMSWRQATVNLLDQAEIVEVESIKTIYLNGFRPPKNTSQTIIHDGMEYCLPVDNITFVAIHDGPSAPIGIYNWTIKPFVLPNMEPEVMVMVPGDSVRFTSYLTDQERERVSIVSWAGQVYNITEDGELSENAAVRVTGSRRGWKLSAAVAGFCLMVLYTA